LRDRFYLSENLENRYFKKLKVLIYADSRGLDITTKKYTEYIKLLSNEFDTESIICTKKWTTTFDFLDYYSK